MFQNLSMLEHIKLLISYFLKIIILKQLVIYFIFQGKESHGFAVATVSG